jgi:hypothetical protein
VRPNLAPRHASCIVSFPRQPATGMPVRSGSWRRNADWTTSARCYRRWLDIDGPDIQKADWSASRRLSRVLDPLEDLSPQKTGLGLRISRSALPSAPPKAPSLSVVAADNCCPVLFARAQGVTWARAAKIQLGPWSKPQFTALDVSTLHGVVVPKCGNIARALDSGRYPVFRVPKVLFRPFKA